jgi:molecular chaperone DnaK
VFRTSAALRRDASGAVLSIPVVEGESGRADRNRRVGVLEVRATDLRRDLPACTEVEVTIEIDDSRLVTVVADVPVADDQFEAAIDLGRTVAPTPQELEAELAAAEHRYRTLRPAAETSGSPAARRILDVLDEHRSPETARQMVAAARVDLGAAAAADESLRSLQALLDDLEDEVELPRTVGSLESLLTDTESLANRFGGTADRHELATLRTKAAAEPNRATANALADRAEDLYWSMRQRARSGRCSCSTSCAITRCWPSTSGLSGRSRQVSRPSPRATSTH